MVVYSIYIQVRDIHMSIEVKALTYSVVEFAIYQQP